jgi:putative two-component system response regulator
MAAHNIANLAATLAANLSKAAAPEPVASGAMQPTGENGPAKLPDLGTRKADEGNVLSPEEPRAGDLFQTSGGLSFHWEDELVAQDKTSTILIVDSLEINRRLLKAMLKSANYRFLEAKRATEALALMESERVDLVILDLMIPEMSGPEFCRRLKTNRKTKLVPILLLTSVQGVENEIHGIDSGADEYLTKPLHPAVVRARIRAMLRNKAAVDSLEEAETILFALAQAVECRDHYTAGHCARLANYSVAMGMALGLPRTDLLALYRGGYLHDIGKIGIPDRILHGLTDLTEEEWAIMHTHTVEGERICRPMKSLAPVLPIIRSHHERWDGKGYPDRLAGEDIPLLARIMQVVDIYDALTTARTYKPAMPHEEAVRILLSEAGNGWRDPDLVSIFVSLSSSQPLVELRSAEAALEWPAADSVQTSLQNMGRQINK